MRTVRGKKKLLFGGGCLALIEGLYQLPSVVTARERGIFEGHYASPFSFDSRAYERLDVELVELEKIYRKQDGRFIEILNAISNNTASDAAAPP